VIVFLGAFFPIFTSTYRGAIAVPTIIKETALSLGVRGIKYHLQIIFPAALPNIFTGIQTGVGMGWMAIIAAEMISGQAGLGYAIEFNRLNLQYQLIALDIAVIGVIGFILHSAVVRLEKLIIPWHFKSLGEK
jgi:ABC-type nitrate/sulfonate/bicarbonate transport system permease component